MLRPQWDYVLDCIQCQRLYVFPTYEDRAEEMAKHEGHAVDLYRQGRV